MNEMKHEDIYCSQQICIPPMYPYILKQFAKAAIRSQPRDLLRWACAYFRCLALNVPPPVKTKLEFPIPRDYFGVTPGWLKALYHQMIGKPNVHFRILWDKWIGATLVHKTLIEILCLGRFTDPAAVPIFRFIGLCAGYLTDSLTETMLLFCEIITEEPEGASASISVEIFNDVYQFLAGIDASKPQLLYNLYFTDSILGLYQPPPPTPPSEVVEEESTEQEEEQVEEESAVTVEEEEAPVDDGVYSCPDIVADTEPAVVVEDDTVPLLAMDNASFKCGHSDQDLYDDDIEFFESARLPPPEGFIEFEAEETELEIAQEAEEKGDNLSEELPCDEEERQGWTSQSTIIGKDGKKKQSSGDVFHLDLSLIQTCPSGGEEEEIAEDSIEYIAPGVKSSVELKKSKSKMSSMDFDMLIQGDDVNEGPEEFLVGIIPGIGAKVPPLMVKNVIEFMLNTSKEQHGMVMPRNVRHFSCPPLEIYVEYEEIYKNPI